jgi:hypothetical protein
MIKLLQAYGLKKKIIVDVKNECSYWNAMIDVLSLFVNCEIFRLEVCF